jgi:hypothetical protein
MSLLPQFSRTGSAEHKKDADIVERENRDPDIAQNDGANETAANDARQADRMAMPPPPVSKLSRGLSTRVPAVSQLGRAPSTRAHTRTQSVQSTATSAKPEAQRGAISTPSVARPSGTETGLKRTPSTTSSSQAPRTIGLARTASVKAPQPPGRARGASVSTITPTTGLRRTNSVRPTPISIPSASQVPPAPSPTSPRKVPELRPSGKSQLPSSSRPTFSTFQQHYSPAKTALPKPPVPTSKFAKAAPNFEQDASVPFDVALQQIELLQLSLLHETSAQTTRQYTDDAKRKLGKKHAKLRKDFEAVCAAETAQQKVANLKALQAWCPDPSLLAGNLQTLARVHKDVVAITHPESRYTELLHVFEDWADSAEKRITSPSGGFVEPLPGPWREAHASTALKIRSLQREMSALPPLPEQNADAEVDTSLRVILSSCRSLVDGILRELDVMGKLEKELLGQESARIDGAVGALSLNEGNAWVPAWQ